MDKALLIVMAKWHAYGRCKQDYQKILVNLFCKYTKEMTEHTVSVAQHIRNKGLIDISLAISGLGFKKVKDGHMIWELKILLTRERMFRERMKRQILINKKISSTKQEISFL